MTTHLLVGRRAHSVVLNDRKTVAADAAADAAQQTKAMYMQQSHDYNVAICCYSRLLVSGLPHVRRMNSFAHKDAALLVVQMHGSIRCLHCLLNFKFWKWFWAMW